MVYVWIQANKDVLFCSVLFCSVLTQPLSIAVVLNKLVPQVAMGVARIFDWGGPVYDVVAGPA